MIRTPSPFPALFLLAALLLAANCGGAEEARQEAVPLPTDVTTDDAPAAETDEQTGSFEDELFVLDQELPVSPRFEAAYQRGVPIVVEFFQQGQDPYYPQGLEVDDMVNEDLTALRDDYPQVEFFTYDIDNPGTGEDLGPGEYGSLAAQLNVGYTPFVAMLAPREEGYFVEDVFQGYVDRAVLDQALYELSTEVHGNASYVPLGISKGSSSPTAARAYERTDWAWKAWR